MRVRAAIGLIGIGCAAQVNAQMGMGGGGPGGGMARPIMPNVDRETMILAPLDDWYAGEPRSGQGKLDIFLFQEGEDATDWTETLQQEIYSTTAGMEAAARVYELRSAGDEANCPDYSSEIRQEDPDNGYSTIVWRQTCRPSADQIFASLHKAVLGNDRLYILSKIWKEEPSGRIWRRWENYFDDVYVCDPNRTEHPCRAIPPDPGNATGGGGRSAL